MRLDAVNDLVAAAARRAGLAGPPAPHQMRHAFASNVLDAGGSIDEAQELLGPRVGLLDGGLRASRPCEAAGRGRCGPQPAGARRAGAEAAVGRRGARAGVTRGRGLGTACPAAVSGFGFARRRAAGGEAGGACWTRGSWREAG